MKIIQFGATGQGRERLRELVHRDFTDSSLVEGELAGFDARPNRFRTADVLV